MYRALPPTVLYHPPQTTNDQRPTKTSNRTIGKTTTKMTPTSCWPPQLQVRIRCFCDTALRSASTWCIHRLPVEICHHNRNRSLDQLMARQLCLKRMLFALALESEYLDTHFRISKYWMIQKVECAGKNYYAVREISNCGVRRWIVLFLVNGRWDHNSLSLGCFCFFLEYDSLKFRWFGFRMEGLGR